jgi:hypothetical protein
MGRAFRVVKRTAHLTVAVAEKAIKVSATPVKGARKAAPKPRSGGASKAAAPRTRSKKVSA